MRAFALSTESSALNLHYTYTASSSSSSSCCCGQKGYRGVAEGKRNILPRQTDRQKKRESRDIQVPRYKSSTYHLLLVCSITCAELHLPYLSRQSSTPSTYLHHHTHTPHQCTLFFLILLLSTYKGWARDYPYPLNPLSDQLSARFSLLFPPSSSPPHLLTDPFSASPHSFCRNRASRHRNRNRW